MRIQITLLFLAFSFSNILIRQTKYGIKAGVSISDQHKKINLSGNPSEKVETKLLTGFQLGAFIKHNLNWKFSFATELNFSTLRSKTKYMRTDFIVNSDGTISGPTTGFYNDKVQQLEIPIFLQYNVKQFYLGLGQQ